MTSPIDRTSAVLGSLAAVTFVGALLVFGQLLEGYRQGLYPVALLGADGVPRAAAFNALGFGVPGFLAAAVAWRLRGALPAAAPLLARLGTWMVLISGIGFSLQGLLPLDPQDLDSPASRAHSLAWMLWWVAFTPGALAYGLGMGPGRGRGGSRQGDVGLRLSRVASLSGLVLAVLVCGCAAFAGGLLGPAVAQRIAFGAWFAWLVVMASASPRRNSRQVA